MSDTTNLIMIDSDSDSDEVMRGDVAMIFITTLFAGIFIIRELGMLW